MRPKAQLSLLLLARVAQLAEEATWSPLDSGVVAKTKGGD